MKQNRTFQATVAQGVDSDAARSHDGVTMTWVLAAAAIALGVVLLTTIWRRAWTDHVPVPRREPWTDATANRAGARIQLDLGGVDPDDPAVERLAREAARHALHVDPKLDHVEVVDRDGLLLVREARHRPHREVALPEVLSEPHTGRPHRPSPVRADEPERHPRRVPEPPPTVVEAPLADRLDLPARVRTRVRHPDRAVDVVHAILGAAGRPSTVDGDLVRCGEVAIVVVDPRVNAEAALTHGYLRVDATDAVRGLVIRTGYADPRLVRRREAAAPHVRHVGPDALQRMADAVAVGADPLRFAAGPVAVAGPAAVAGPSAG